MLQVLSATLWNTRTAPWASSRSRQSRMLKRALRGTVNSVDVAAGRVVARAAERLRAWQVTHRECTENAQVMHR